MYAKVIYGFVTVFQNLKKKIAKGVWKKIKNKKQYYFLENRK